MSKERNGIALIWKGRENLVEVFRTLRKLHGSTMSVGYLGDKPEISQRAAYHVFGTAKMAKRDFMTRAIEVARKRLEATAKKAIAEVTTTGLGAGVQGAAIAKAQATFAAGQSTQLQFVQEVRRAARAGTAAGAIDPVAEVLERAITDAIDDAGAWAEAPKKDYGHALLRDTEAMRDGVSRGQ